MTNSLVGALARALVVQQKSTAVAPLNPARGGWHNLMSIIREPFAGAWQRNIDLRPQNVATHPVVYACVTRIASDIGKLGLGLVEDQDGIWADAEAPAFSPVLRKPNHYQTRQQFIKHWLFSKLFHGNTYVWKEYDARGVVTELYVLDPCTTRPLVAPDGSVYYQIKADNLSGISTEVTVPASLIIHDVGETLFHPLCGVSPITACALTAAHGLNIMNNSAAFFANGANPGGILVFPGNINQDDADRLKEVWETKFTGRNVGRIAVLGNGGEYKQLPVNAVDSQLIEQLKWTGETICTALGVPGYKVGVGQMPAYNNIGALNTQYFSETLQDKLFAIQTLLAEGLKLPQKYRVHFDLEDLLLMDMTSRMQISKDGVSAAIFKPDEARKKFNLPPVTGGDTPYLQQQNYSLSALAKRDAQDDPFGKMAPAAAPALPAPDQAANDNSEAAAKEALDFMRKEFAIV